MTHLNLPRGSACAASLLGLLLSAGNLALASQGDAGPPQVSLSPAGGGLGAARPWERTEEAEAPELKLTTGLYRYRGDLGHDINLRWQQGNTHAWVGAYEDRQFGSQWRTGADGSWGIAPWVALQPSLQLATGGFVGGSINLQVGGAWYGVVGWGRTNLKSYFNLNFDPNDATTLGLGWHDDSGHALSTTVVADDRLHTGQRHWHMTARWPLPDGQRLTLDLLRKSGQGDAGFVRAWGWSSTIDWPTWFLHVARDPQQNFSAQDALRVSLGKRW